MKRKEEKQTFKHNLERLEEIAEQLEDESLDLEDAIKLYEEGIALNALCLKTLQEAELKITQLKNSLPVQNADMNSIENDTIEEDE